MPTNSPARPDSPSRPDLEGLKVCPVTWRMRTDAEIASGVLPELPDGKIYGWMTKGGTIYAGEGYPVPRRQFALDNDSCMALMIARATLSQGTNNE